MNLKSLLFLSLSLGLLLAATAQYASETTSEDPPTLTIQSCSSSGCTPQSYKVVVDANYRYSTCQQDGAATYSDATNCGLDSYAYSTKGAYVTDGTQLSLSNSRLYLVNSANEYEQFDLLGQELTFTVNVAALGCQDVGALYFVNMPKDGLISPRNSAGALYGTGYCDASCSLSSNQYNYVDGYFANGHASACCSEMDVWEGNSLSNQLTAHACGDYTDCGLPGDPSCSSVSCDQGGCYYNTHKSGATWYGNGATIDTSQDFTVITRFHETSGALDMIERVYVQNGVTFGSPQNLTTSSCTGATQLGSFGGVLGSMSIVFSAYAAYSDFLDGCTSGSGMNTVTFKNILYGPIGTTTTSGTAATTGTTTVAASSSSTTGGSSTVSTTSSSTTGGSTTCTGGGSQTAVYSDSLAAGWSDWTGSTVTHSLSNASPVHSGSYSISFGLSNYGELYFHVSPTFQIGTAGSLQFWVNGGSLTISNALWVQFYDSSNSIVGQRALVSVTASTWTQVTVNPLAAAPAGCGLSSSQVVSGFLIQYSNGDSPGTIYLDDVSFGSGGCSSASSTTTTTTSSSSSGTTSPGSCSQYAVGGIAMQSSWTSGSEWQFTLTNGGSSAPSSVVVEINAGGYAVSNGGNMAPSGGGSSAPNYYFAISSPGSFSAGSTETYTFQVAGVPSSSQVSITVSSCS